MPPLRLGPWAFALVAMTAAACSSTVNVSGTPGASGDGGAQPSFTSFPDIPVPARADIDVDRTLVLGGGEAWIGRLVISSSQGAYEMFDFFKAKFPEFGWTEVATVRAKTSVLTFTRQSRVATVQVEGNTFRGADSIITVSPRDPSTSPAGGMTITPAPGSTAPRGPLPSTGTLPARGSSAPSSGGVSTAPLPPPAR